MVGSYGTAPVSPGPRPLSAQELQVARMAAEGLSNRQIGQRLYLSHRTVASHLYRLFPKLGITSRAQLTAMSLDLPAVPPLRPGRLDVPHDD